MLMDKTNEQKKDKHMELHQFRQEPAMMVIYLPVKFEFDWTKRFRVRVQK